MPVVYSKLGINRYPELQALATLTQASPGDGTKYTVLDTTENCIIYRAAANCTWTVQPDPLQVHFTIDGQAIEHDRATPVSGTWYYPSYSHTGGLTAQTCSTTVFSERPFVWQGRSVKMEIEVSGGTVSQAQGRCYYGILNE